MATRSQIPALTALRVNAFTPVSSCSWWQRGLLLRRLFMPKKFLGLIMLSTAFFIVGLCTDKLTLLANAGNNDCLSCIGVG